MLSCLYKHKNKHISLICDFSNNNDLGLNPKLKTHVALQLPSRACAESFRTGRLLDLPAGLQLAISTTTGHILNLIKPQFLSYESALVYNYLAVLGTTDPSSRWCLASKARSNRLGVLGHISRLLLSRDSAHISTTATALPQSYYHSGLSLPLAIYLSC